MRGLVARYAHLKHSSPTQRLLFRKILKGYDQKDVALTMSSRKKQLLEALDKSLLILATAVLQRADRAVDYLTGA
jgi:hypothetical protein